MDWRRTRQACETRVGRARHLWIAVAGIALATIAANLSPVPSTSALLEPVVEERSFSTPGTYSYVVPPGVHRLAVDAVGASGHVGVGLIGHDGGGLGARVEAVLPVTPGEILTVIVGGGNGYGGGPGNGEGDSSGGGGGASSVKRSATRLVVAGGGGGPNTNAPCAGNGGTPHGRDGCPAYMMAIEGDKVITEGGVGGTTTSGGRGCSVASWLASSGETATGPDGGYGGGGGGYYGGGGGCGVPLCCWADSGSASGGGGGSSYTTPSALSAPVYSVSPKPGNGSKTTR